MGVNMNSVFAKEALELAKTKGRCPELENMIALCPNASCSYALFLKEPFKKGEEIIATNPMLSVIYSKEILKKRFKQAEPTIAKDAKASYEYALTHNQRFKEGEQSILDHCRRNDGEIACDYAMNVIKGRWVESEPIILESDRLILKYAVKVIKGRWLEAEGRFRDLNIAQVYARKMIEIEIPILSFVG